LPEKSHEGRSIKAFKIANKTADDNRKGVLILGGVHAREIVNPDLVISFALDLCRAYSTKSGIKYGKASYDKSAIQKIIDGQGIFIIPLVNPDGRAHVMSPTGDAMWRKNMNPNPSLPCKGVDINRNYEFLWESGIGTSSDSCQEIFKGSSAFSEPETRNVRNMLDQYPNIQYMLDVHSYSEDILYPWGDDDNQTSNPSMTFLNPEYNDVRGYPEDTNNPNDPNESKETLYGEFISDSDLRWFKRTGSIISNAISSVRRTKYTIKQSVGLYPTSATSDDYCYGRNIVDTSKGKVLSYTLETGKEFQPPITEGMNIISEVSAGLMAFCISVGGGKSTKKKKSSTIRPARKVGKTARHIRAAAAAK
jgi:murein tripeptide amidase MpaA